MTQRFGFKLLDRKMAWYGNFRMARCAKLFHLATGDWFSRATYRHQLRV